jgi:hypothetical protein
MKKKIHKMCEECKNKCKKERLYGELVGCAKFEEKVYGIK